MLEIAYLDAVHLHNCNLDKRLSCPICKKRCHANSLTRHTRISHGTTSYLCPKCDNFVVINLKIHIKNCTGKVKANIISQSNFENRNEYSVKKKNLFVENKTTKINNTKSLKTKPGELNPFYIRKRANINYELEDSVEVDDPEWDPTNH